MTSSAIRFSDRARSDLANIAIDTVDRWGLARKDRYQALLTRAFERIAAHPEVGRKRDDLRPGLRSLPAGGHIILYRLGEDHISILAILHQRMDIAARLRDVPMG